MLYFRDSRKAETELADRVPGRRPGTCSRPKMLNLGITASFAPQELYKRFVEGDLHRSRSLCYNINIQVCSL